MDTALHTASDKLKLKREIQTFLYTTMSNTTEKDWLVSSMTFLIPFGTLYQMITVCEYDRAVYSRWSQVAEYLDIRVKTFWAEPFCWHLDRAANVQSCTVQL